MRDDTFMDNQEVANQAAAYLFERHSLSGPRIGWMMIASISIEASDLYTISFLLVFLTAQHRPSPLLLGLASAGTHAGGIVGALVGGWLMDRLGRRIMFLGTMVMFIPLALAQAFAPHMETLALFGQHRSRNARGPVSITYSACATELLRSAVSARGANLGQLAGGDRQPAPRLV
jgi:MFS family permease